jgi:hypothetical protein
VANFGLHLIEFRTSEATATLTDEPLTKSAKPKEGDNLFWRAIQKRHQIVTENIRALKIGTERERAMQVKAEDSKHVMPVLSTLLHYQTGKSNRMDIDTFWNSATMSSYGEDLVMGENGGVVSLAEGDDLNAAKYNNTWKARNVAVHLKEAEQLGRANKTSKQACFRESDRITAVTRDWAVGTMTTKLPDHYPASLELLLGVIKSCMIKGRNTKEALLEVAAKYKKEIEGYIAAGVEVSLALGGALEYANVVVNDRVNVRYRRATSNWSLPAHLHLGSNPILSGLLIFNQLFLNHQAAHETETKTAVESFSLQLYNMARQIGGLDIVWEDAEFVIEQRSCERVFGQDARPNTWPNILRCFRSSVARAEKASCAQPSQLMQLLHDYFCYEDDDWMRSFQQFLCAYLVNESQGEEKKDAIMKVPKQSKRKKRAAQRKAKPAASTAAKTTDSAAKAMSSAEAKALENPSSSKVQGAEDFRNPSATMLLTALSELIANEEVGWHFLHYGFRINQCANVVSLAQDALCKVFGVTNATDSDMQSIDFMRDLLERMNGNKKKREATLKFLSEKMLVLLRGKERQGIVEMEETSGLRRDA